MLVTTVEQQNLIGRAARAAGGYHALAKAIAKRRRDTQKRLIPPESTENA